MKETKEIRIIGFHFDNGFFKIKAHEITEDGYSTGLKSVEWNIYKKESLEYQELLHNINENSVKLYKLMSDE